MSMTAESHDLLRAYVAERSEAAFTELVRRHLNIVYATALRRCGGDAALAEDVTQVVFADLARKADSLPSGTVLAAWLYRHCTFVASTAVRAEVRRRTREARAMESSHTDEVADWARVVPVLEEAMQDLSDRDRTAIVLRFLDGQPFARVGASLGISEDAARMRVDRALEKLRAILAGRGVRSTVAALAAGLLHQGAVSAPAGLAACITAGALGALAAGTSSSVGTLGIIGIMKTTKLAAGLAALVAVGSTGIAIQQRATRDRLAAELAAVRAEADQARADAEAARATLVANAERLEEARLEREQLMALRGEIGPLRDTVKELQRQAASLRPAVAAPSHGPAKAPEPETTPDDAETESARALIMALLNYSRQWGLAIYRYTEANEGRMPPSLAEAATFFPEDQTDVLTSFEPDRFELVYHGRFADLAKPAEVIVMRQRQPFVGVNRKLSRTYLFADGHSLVYAPPDGDFESWERARSATAAGSIAGGSSNPVR